MGHPNYPVVYAHLRPKIEDAYAGSKNIDNTMAAEILDHLIAGNDGAGNTLTFLAWQLARHPQIQRRLREELLTVEKGDQWTQELESLPLLDAVLMETMRLHPAGLGPHLRVVPKEGTRLASFSIPSDTTVSATAWAMHRNKEVFPGPEEWQSERWLGEHNRKEMQKWFFAFGTGGRKCIGSFFAIRGMDSPPLLVDDKVKFKVVYSHQNFCTCGIHQV